MNILEQLFSLHGKVALVTGASGGIGRELAIGLGAAGASVIVHGRDQAELQRTELEIEQAGGRATIIAGDLRDSAACRSIVVQAHRAHGRLDVLVNCAGMNRRKPIAEATEDDFDAIVAVNLKSLFVLSQSAREIMAGQGGGKIVHIASLTSFMGLGTTSVYGMTKAAVVQLAKTQAIEWAKDNIQVNCLAPGFIRTPLTEKSLWDDPDKRRWLMGRIPAQRPGEARDLLAALLLLTSPGADYLTGQTITVDGGVLAGGSWDE